MGSGKARRDMGLHIDSDSARRHMQSALLPRISHGHVDARYVDDWSTAERFGETLGPKMVAFETLPVLVDDGTSHQRRASGQAGCQAAGDPEADYRRHVRVHRLIELGLEPRPIAAA
jgi:hypothetical protein